MKASLTALTGLLLIGIAQAQTTSLLPSVSSSSNAPFMSTNPGAVSARTPSARAGDFINARDFGAIGTGTSTTAGAALGISTLAGLAGYSVNGATPYAFINQYPFGVLFNLNPEAGAASGATTLSFQTTGIVETQIPTVSSAVTGAISIAVGDLSITIDATAISAGVGVSGSNIQSGTLVSSVAGYPGNWTIGLSKPTSGAIVSGAYMTFAAQPASGAYSLPVIAASGIEQGDIVLGACIPSGAQVDYVNHAKNEIELSAPTTCQVSALETLTFTPSWLSNVVAGMMVQGPTGAVANGSTVTSVNSSSGVVNLSAPLTGAVTPDSPIPVSGGTPTTATPITFYRPYTDAEATNLQMDRLGLQAAINAAGASVGGTVALPANSTFLLDGPVILPIYAPYGSAQAAITIAGQSETLNGAFLRPTKDFGPGSAMLSCGDPSGKSSNGRGIYTGATGYFCTGALRNVTIAPSSFTNAFGLRPKWSGAPVAMDGIKQGPRLFLDNIEIQGFNNGSLFAGDHTEFHLASLNNNFNGLRFDDQQGNLFGDEVFNQLNASGNAWAGISVAPTTFVNGDFIKEYLSSNAYAIWCEPGPNAGMCLQGATMTNGNNENVACGEFKDGDIQDGWVAAGGRRTLMNVLLINEFNSGNGFGSANVPTPLGGCEFAAYYDIAYVSDFRIEEVWPNDYSLVANAFAYILRTSRLDAFQATGAGGFYMGGQGVWALIQNARAYGQNLVWGPSGFSGAFGYTASWQYVTLEGPTFRARPIPFNDSSNPISLPLGALVEYGSTLVNNVQAVQLAGTTSGAALAGVVCQNWGSNPYSQQIAPIICVGGSRLPVLTAATASAGQYLKASTTTHGTSTTATGIADTDVAGVAPSAASSSTLTYIRPLWPAQY